MIGSILILLAACTKDYDYVLPPLPPKPAPKVSEPTTTLEAWYSSTAPNTLNAAFWKTANYLPVNVTSIDSGMLYGDGFLNMTGTYRGMRDFNKGYNPKLTLKAAYDSQYVYVLAEWYDSTVSVSNGSWLYNGSIDQYKPSEATAGYTSQRNCDKMAMAFEISSASSPSGSFTNVGCGASCHGSGSSAQMTPTTGSVDIWNWSLATSSPLGYAHDMISNTSGLSNDAGQCLATRNSISSTSRSGPAYEWDGTTQTVTLPNGQTSILDPTYYLLNKTAVTGSVSSGETLFNNTAKCYTCHGPNGNGHGNGGSEIDLVTYNNKSRVSLKDAMDNVSDMVDYWGILSPQQQDDLVTYLHGLSGTPGYYLNGANSTDIKVITNVTPTQISNSSFTSTNHHSKYQVLIIRKLKTGNADDVQFNLSANKAYVFGIALMDNDGINHVGSLKETLTFK